MAERAAVFNAANGTAQPLADMMGEVVNIRDLLVMPMRTPDKQTGEESDWVRTVLITTDGKRYECGSEGVIQSLQRAADTFGPPPWEEGLPFRPVQRKTANKNTMILLEIDTLSLET